MADSSHFKKKYIKMVDKYLEECEDTEGEFHKTRGDNSDSYEQTIEVKLPSVEGFVIWLRNTKKIKLVRKTLYNWAKTNEDFATALEKIKDEQLTRLINKGLSGKYHPVIAKLMLSSNHGMREKSDVTSDDKPINTFSDEQVDRIAERIRTRSGSNGDTPSA